MLTTQNKWQELYDSYIDMKDKEPRMVCVYNETDRFPFKIVHVFSKEQAIREAEALDLGLSDESIIRFEYSLPKKEVTMPLWKTHYP